MRKKLSFSLAVMSFMAFAMFASCQKDEEVVARFDATMEGFTSDGKTVLNGSDLYWVPGDRIEIFGTNSNYGTYEYETQVSGNVIPFNCVYGNAGEARYHAIYPASSADVNGRLVLPDVQQSPDGSLTGYPMYAESNNTFLDFKNLGGVLLLQLRHQGVSVSSIQVTANHNLSGTFTINYNNGKPTLTEVTGTNTVTLSLATPQDISTAKNFYISLPPNTFSFLQIKIYTTDGHMCTKTMYNGSVSITRSNITTIQLTGDNHLDFTANAGELPGLFSIAEGVKVHFASGNMQFTTQGTHAVVGGTANGTPNGTWRFAPNQYDYIGQGNANISSDYKGWIDLFGWGTSGWSGSGATAYMPYSTASGGASYGPRDGSDLTGTNANADWAVYNAISNAGNQPGQWRTLTKEEWMYMTTGRSDYDKKRGSGSVNGVGGHIFLPDNWQQPADCPVFVPGYSDDQSAWGPNTYTSTQWAKMEASGALFLPAAGQRSQQRVARVGTSGGYWSVTAHGNLNAVGPYILSVNPEGAGSDYDYYWNKPTGICVRPVRVAN